MSKKSFVDLQREITALQAEADKAKSRELSSIVARIKADIAAYGIAPGDLFGSRSSRGSKAAKPPSVARYGDGQGNEWAGRGKRPQWLRAALDSGRQLEEFRLDADNAVVKQVGSSTSMGGSGGTAARTRRNASGKKAAGKAPLPVKFKDDAGNTWGGRGPQPQWIKAALAQGKHLEDFRV